MKIIRKLFFKNFCFLFFILSCITSFSFAQKKDQGFKMLNDKAKLVKIPFSICNNLIIIDAIFNQKDTLHLILDSGVENIIITDPAIGKKLNLAYSSKVNVKGAGVGSNLFARVSSGNNINLPGIIGNNLKVLVLSEDIFDLPSYLGKEVHGLIGYDLFSKFVIEFSVLKKNLIFYDPKNFVLHSNKFFTVPINIVNSKPYVTVKVFSKSNNAIDYILLIDTGASHALSLTTDSINGIVPSNKAVQNHLGVGFSGDILGLTDLLNQFQIGKFCFKNVVTSFPNQNNTRESKVFKSSGSIGGEIFRRFTVIFDYQNKLIYLKKNMYLNDSFDYNKSGIILVARGENLNKYIVANVNTNSVSSKANIMVNDEIIAINTTPSSQLNLNQINAIFSGKSGKKVDLILKRDNELITKSIILEDFF